MLGLYHFLDSERQPAPASSAAIMLGQQPHPHFLLHQKLRPVF